MTVVVGNIIHLTSSIIHPTGRGTRWSLRLELSSLIPSGVRSKRFRSATLGDACQSKNNSEFAFLKTIYKMLYI